VPELPEVEAAAAIARQVLEGRVIAAVTTHHASQRRTLPDRSARRVAGRRVVRVERHAKHQHLVLDDGAIVAVHFHMNGDWEVATAPDPLPRFTRIVFATADGARLCLVDSRALCTATYHAPNHPPRLVLGPEPDGLTPEHLRHALARRSGPIKPALLDQRVVAGLGNIYAAEALWRARLHPAQRAHTLSDAQRRALVRGIQAAIADGFKRQGRYRDGTRERPFKVYDREGRPCTRCRTPIARLMQAGRSTYYCPSCQRRGRTA
jgi:formamidopyrimidine-DNA glycosylase